MTRRDFVYGSAMALSGAEAQDPWAAVPAILKRIQAPKFARRDFPITKYGGRAGDDCTEAIRKAIDACAKAGGGRVVIEGGKFLTGAIHLKSGVNLYVDKSATLLFKTEPEAYMPVVFTRWEGTECMNFSSLIYANGQTNVAVTGEGTLDGQAADSNWWEWKRTQRKDRDQLLAWGDQDAPVPQRMLGLGHFLRPNFITTLGCKNVLVEGVTILRSPMWEVHPVLSSNVTVRNIKVNTHGPNNDGCDPECCTDVLIEGCEFDTGDDCIAIKSGRNRDGRRVARASENLIVRNCVMKDGHGGVTLGSEISGNCRNVYVEDCKMSSPHLNQALRIKTNAVRGGIVENFFIRNVTLGKVAMAVLEVDCLYEEGARGPEKPVVRNIDIRNVTCDETRNVLNLRGLPVSPIRDVRLTDCTFAKVARADVKENVEGLVMKNVRENGEVVGS